MIVVESLKESIWNGFGTCFLTPDKAQFVICWIIVFFSPEDVGVFADQKWKNAASEIDVPVDEEDNSDVQYMSEWTVLSFKMLLFCWRVEWSDAAVFQNWRLTQDWQTEDEHCFEETVFFSDVFVILKYVSQQSYSDALSLVRNNCNSC